MKRISIVVIGIIALLGVAACVSSGGDMSSDKAAMSDSGVTGEALTALLVGSKMSGKGFVTMYNSDMTSSVTQDSGNNDVGTYRIKEDGSSYCGTWKTIRHGQEACFTVSDPGDGMYQISRVGGNGNSLKVTIEKQ